MTLFPTEFLWGASTSAYQIEGSPLADGAGPSNWHQFAHTPGKTANGDTGDTACDHYRKWGQDIDIMGQLGLQSYRFSLSWSRIFPEGTGAVNTRGLDFYDKLVDGLLAAGIQPFPTLYHWDLPAALEKRGGWINRDIADWFTDYAEVVFKRLGDRVTRWSTLNEPWVVVDSGYVLGLHAPGRKNLAEAAQATHNLLRAHGQAVRCFHASQPGEIGIVVNLEPKDAASETEADVAAARRADAYMNRQYLDPIFLGRYPIEMSEMFGTEWPVFPAEDFELIGEPIDFIGLNYYTRTVNQYDASAKPTCASPVPQPNAQYSAMDWEVHPKSLTRILLWMKERYGQRPIYITENGAAFDDPKVNADGHIVDRPRLEYFRKHLRAIRDAMDLGVDVRGYFAWSLLDNFEWALGFDKKFGIVQVDFDSQARTIKDSGLFYRDVIATRGAALADTEQP